MIYCRMRKGFGFFCVSLFFENDRGFFVEFVDSREILRIFFLFYGFKD